jgi:hypothetical protein
VVSRGFGLLNLYVEFYEVYAFSWEDICNFLIRFLKTEMWLIINAVGYMSLWLFDRSHIFKKASIIFFFFGTISYYITQTDLKLVVLLRLPPLC